MRSYRVVPVLLGMIILCAGCAGREAAPPPQLLKPAAIEADTAAVTQGHVIRVNQIRGFVRLDSEKLFYGDTDLRFGEYFCVPGERVTEGQLLVRLDAEELEEQAEDQRQEIDRLRTEHSYENELLELDITIAQTEAAALAQAVAGYDEAAMQALEQKRIDVERLRLNLTHQKENQALALRYAQEDLDGLQEQLAEAELRAPYDGVIIYREEKTLGDFMEPFAPLLYISNERDIFVEYSNSSSVSVNKNAVIKGFAGGKEYALERIPLSVQDSLYYANLSLTAPLRFAFADQDTDIPPGTFVNIWIYDHLVEDVLRVPSNALFTSEELGFYVYVMEDGVKVLRTVEPGARSDSYTEIVSGVTEGEVLYVK